MCRRSNRHGMLRIDRSLSINFRLVRTTIFVHNTKGKYSANLTLDLLSRYGVTSFCAPPTAYRLLVVEDLTKYDLGALRSCVGAGEPLNPEVIDIWKNQTRELRNVLLVLNLIIMR